MKKNITLICSAVVGVLVFLFWWLLYPQALGLHEQNQLFLFTWDFLTHRMSVVGGFADYVAEFITQFYYVTWIGALLLAALFVAFQELVWAIIRKKNNNTVAYIASWFPAVCAFLNMGNHDVMLSYLVALIITSAFCLLWDRKKNLVLGLAITVIGYYLVGPAIFVFAAYAAIKEFSGKSAAYLLAFVAAVIVCRVSFMQQYPWKEMIFGINYFRLPLMVPEWQIASAVMLVLVMLIPSFQKLTVGLVAEAMMAVFFCSMFPKCYDKDTYEVIAYDQLVRQEKWDDVLNRAKKYQPASDLGCVSINLSLFMTGRMDKDLAKYKQYGVRGLIMPRVRDYISNSSTCEVFWRMGMVNEALRYAFDTQESIYNHRKSGRWLARIAECQIINGRYKAAEKYIDLLSHTLFYSKWAKEHRQYLYNDAAVMGNPIYAYIKSARYEQDFLYDYNQMDKMLAILYNTNRNNIMAGYYYQAWKMISGNKEVNEENSSSTSGGN